MSECWLLSNALHVTITMALKPKDKFGITPFIVTLMGRAMVVALELSMFCFQHQKACDVLNSFLSFLTKYEEKKTHKFYL